MTVEQPRWSRIPVVAAAAVAADGHPHSFVRDGEDKRTAKVEVCFVPFFSP